MSKWFVPLVALIGCGNLAHAEGGCPPDRSPYGTPQARRCVPIAAGARQQAMSHCERSDGVQCKVVESQRSRSEWIE